MHCGQSAEALGFQFDNRTRTEVQRLHRSLPTPTGITTPLPTWHYQSICEGITIHLAIYLGGNIYLFGKGLRFI